MAMRRHGCKARLLDLAAYGTEPSAACHFAAAMGLFCWHHVRTMSDQGLLRG